MIDPAEYLRVSYSSLNTFHTCNRKFEFSKLYPKRERVFEDFYAADVGKALHAGYQNYLIANDKESAIWHMMKEFPFESEYRQDNDYRSFDAALATLEEMMVEARMTEYELAKIIRPPSPTELLLNPAAKGEIVPAIEVPFELRFKGITLPDGRGVAFTGFIDAILRHHMTGLFRTMDIKTSRESLPDATPKFKFDSQQVPYGVVVDHVAQASVDAFEVLYLFCYVDILNPKAVFYPFMKTRQDIQEWITNRLLQVQAIQRYMANDYFPRTDNGCMFYKKPCAFMEPCISRDRSQLTEWFLLGEEPAKEEPFHPWIIADIDVGIDG